jgi:hypothetical protein
VSLIQEAKKWPPMKMGASGVGRRASGREIFIFGGGNSAMRDCLENPFSSQGSWT